MYSGGLHELKNDDFIEGNWTDSRDTAGNRNADLAIFTIFNGFLNHFSDCDESVI